MAPWSRSTSPSTSPLTGRASQPGKRHDGGVASRLRREGVIFRCNCVDLAGQLWRSPREPDPGPSGRGARVWRRCRTGHPGDTETGSQAGPGRGRVVRVTHRGGVGWLMADRLHGRAGRRHRLEPPGSCATTRWSGCRHDRGRLPVHRQPALDRRTPSPDRFGARVTRPAPGEPQGRCDRRTGGAACCRHRAEGQGCPRPPLLPR